MCLTPPPFPCCLNVCLLVPPTVWQHGMQVLTGPFLTGPVVVTFWRLDLTCPDSTGSNLSRMSSLSLLGGSCHLDMTCLDSTCFDLLLSGLPSMSSLSLLVWSCYMTCLDSTCFDLRYMSGVKCVILTRS